MLLNNKPIKARLRRWVKALRSSEYRQARRALKVRNIGFCCLGVACDLYVKETEKLAWDDSGLSSEIDNEKGMLPDCIRDWFGLESRDPRLSYDDMHNRVRASLLNDESKFSFAQIADAIEQTYELKRKRK